MNICNKRANQRGIGYGVSEMQFCTTERPQLFEFKVGSSRTFRLTLFQLAKDNFYHCDSISRDKA